VGRDAAAAPAVGSHRLHKEEQEQILAEAFSL
jgi:2-oxoglutarate dehydrogenase E1 component